MVNGVNIHKYLNRLGYKVKHSRLLRCILAPFMNARYRMEDAQYSKTQYPEQIARFKDKYTGKRCFIVGNGPSLTVEDLDQLKHEYSFGSNRIYSVFDNTSWRPTFYAAADMDLIPTMVEHIESFSPEVCFIDKRANDLIDPSSAVYPLNLRLDFFSPKKHTTDNISFSTEPSKRVAVGYTVTYICLQLALYMGFTNIYLIGMDHSFTWVIDSEDKVTQNNGVNDHCYLDTDEIIINPQYREGVEFAYALARKEAEKRGAKIYNATRGGTLEVFDRIAFDELVFEQKSKNTI